jgi:pilus assembly protein CpaE
MLAAALEKVTQRRMATAAQGRLIAVVGTAGGVGASSIAANLAVELAAMATRGVVLADLDFRFGQISTLLDVETTYTIADLCESHEQLEPQVIERALVKHASGIRVLARPTQFVQAENISAAHCVSVLTGLTGMYEYVVVDGPTRFDPGAKAVLDLADDILLVMHLLVPCVRNVSRVLDSMREVGFNLDRVRLVCNRAGRHSGNLSADDVRETLGIKVFSTLPDDWPTMSGAVNLGEPLASFAEKSRLRAALRDLAERLHRPDVQADEQKTGRRAGVFSKIFSDA